MFIEFKPYDKSLIKLVPPDLTFKDAILKESRHYMDGGLDIDYYKRYDVDRIMDTIEGNFTVDIEEVGKSFFSEVRMIKKHNTLTEGSPAERHFGRLSDQVGKLPSKSPPSRSGKGGFHKSEININVRSSMLKRPKSPLDRAKISDRGKMKSISSALKTLVKRKSTLMKEDSPTGTFCESYSSNDSKADTIEPIIDSQNPNGNGESSMPKKSGRIGSGVSEDSPRSHRISIMVPTIKSGYKPLLKRDAEGLRTGVNPWMRPTPP
jgi:hypothetical protein